MRRKGVVTQEAKISTPGLSEYQNPTFSHGILFPTGSWEERNPIKKEEEVAKEKEAPKELSRREFVKGAAVGAAAVAGAGALASCAAPTPEVIKETVEVPVEVTKIVEVPGPPGEAGPVTLEVPDPSGAFEVTELHAPRLDTLEGKTICMLGNESWQQQRTSPYIQELLEKMYPTATFIPYTEFPTEINDKKIGGIVKDAGCDAVIIGNAG